MNVLGPTGRAALVVLACTVAFVAAPGSRPAPDAPAVPVASALTSAVSACPAAPAPGRGTEVFLGALPSSGDDVTAEVAPLEDRTPESRTLRPGVLDSADLPAPGGAVLRVQNTPRPGVFAFRAETSPSLAVAGCPQPRADWWFAGAGAGAGHRSVVYLANVDAGPAVVDLRVHGPEGVVDSGGAGRDLVVPPGGTLRVPLVDLAPKLDDVTVEVAADRGRVVASVLDRVAGRDRDVREWLSPAQAGTDLTVAALPSGVDRPRLSVTNTSADQALVEVRVVTERGSFVPLGSGTLSVDPGAVVTLDLAGVLTEAAAVRVTSESDLVAALSGRRDGDTGVAASALPLTGPAVALPVGRRSDLWLTAGDGAAEVTFEAYGGSRGETRREAEEVRVPAGVSRTWRVPRWAEFVVVTPRGASRVDAALLSSGGGLAVSRLLPLPYETVRPVVQPAS